MVTVHDVAREAGVSISTVSRTLATPERVAPGTRDRVTQVARRLGYTVNRAASVLRAGRTGALGLVVPDLANPYFAAVAKGAQTRARERGLGLFVVDTDEDPDLEIDAVAGLVPQTDGVLLCSPRAVGRALEVAGEAVVLVNHQADGVPSVVADHAGGMLRAVEHLRALGHRRIAYAAGPERSWSDGQRRQGLQRAAEHFDDVEAVTFGPFAAQVPGGEAAADLVVASGATAVVTFNDLIAIGLIGRLRARGLEVPRDLSVVGCDDSYVASLVTPALTTLRADLRAIGRRAVDHLVAVAAAGATAPDPVPRLAVELVVRSTTAPPATNLP
ncbi:substrate-binding domain-containing protein [Jiangella mangrovi]|uniref:LacI family transcriptional regulator n=1 Tax=Jiangella mangrovi TaxID=1524084 RepID=A0A7W9LP66_9ACTN|nr:LacI family transcriptional regulator [Jiangella mangrovi]